MVIKWYCLVIAGWRFGGCCVVFGDWWLVDDWLCRCDHFFLFDVTFFQLQKPLSDAKIGIVTTASLFNPENGDQGPLAPYNGKAKFFISYAEPISPFPDVRVSHIAIDRAHTTAKDMASYFPLAAMLRLASSSASAPWVLCLRIKGHLPV